MTMDDILRYILLYLKIGEHRYVSDDKLMLIERNGNRRYMCLMKGSSYLSPMIQLPSELSDDEAFDYYVDMFENSLWIN